jgi:hypothetical protein
VIGAAIFDFGFAGQISIETSRYQEWLLAPYHSGLEELNEILFYPARSLGRGSSYS